MTTDDETPRDFYFVGGPKHDTFHLIRGTPHRYRFAKIPKLDIGKYTVFFNAFVSTFEEYEYRLMRLPDGARIYGFSELADAEICALCGFTASEKEAQQ